MATFRTWRTLLIFRFLLCFVAASLAWLQVSPAYASGAALARENARQEAWHLAHLPHVIALASPAQQKALQRKNAPKPIAEVRSLSLSEMKAARGRGIYRHPEYCGTLPWQKSLRDVNLSNGNLFKSFTDVQVAPGRGAGLVLQRTYNSNEGRVGPFGVGWTHAYDIRIQEAAAVRAEESQVVTSADVNQVPRTDFFGAKHSYHRDADGLYSPPPYLYDETSSDYGKFLVNGPPQVMDDTEKGMDGTIKHYVSVVTNADGTLGNERACDYIQDRHGNTTNLTYGQSYVQPDGSTRKLLTKVNDPSGRVLTFVWNNFGTATLPAWRIVEVDAPLDPATGKFSYRVTYGYYTDPNSANAANELYNLKTVTLDPDGLSRTNTFTYTSQAGNTATEYGLLASISDPLGHIMSYSYAYQSGFSGANYNNIQYPATPDSIYVAQVTEPGGQDALGNPRTHVWTVNPAWEGGNDAVSTSSQNSNLTLEYSTDGYGRYSALEPEDEIVSLAQYASEYDSQNNVVLHTQDVYNPTGSGTFNDKYDRYTYGPHGNVLTHRVVSSGYYPSEQYYPGQETTAYYNASKYFQKQSFTDMNGHVTAIDYYSNQDPSPGNRGEVNLVQDAGYADPNSPSYQKQFTYTYNQYGQKLTETNLRGVVTQYTYGDQWGNLTQVVQDPGGAGHLNRTTTMVYDIMGRVLQSTDPAGQTSTFSYNTLGQPKTVTAPAKSGLLADTIAYSYDGNGRTHSVTDNRGTSTPYVTTMAYETGCDRVHSVTDSVTGTTSYTYDLLGDRLTMSLPGGSTWTYTYLTVLPGYRSAPLNCTCLPDQNPDHMTAILSQINDDQGRVIYYGITSQARLAAKTIPAASDTNLAVQYISDTTGGSQCNSRGWLQEVKTTLQGGLNNHESDRILSQNDYTFDTMGQRLTNTVSTQAIDAAVNPQPLTSRQETYTYDDLNRLSTVNYGDGETQSYGFDPMGNRLTKSDSVTSGSTMTTNATAYAYDAANRLTSTALNGASASAVTSDADGNTLTDTSGRTNTWDSQNRLTSCTKGGVTSTFTYGADGLRRSSTVNNVTTYYAYDGTTMIREMKKNSSTGALFNTATYLQGPQGGECRIDETQVTENYTNPLTYAQGVRGQTSWYVYDGLGSVQGELRITGPGSGGATSAYAFTASPKYDVYGAARVGGTGASSRQGFVGSLGHVSDTETGLIYMRARYYDPNVGRFESEDEGRQGNDWFAYCSNNPTNLIDQSGKEFDPVEPGMGIYDLKEIWDDYQETLALSRALATVLRTIAKAKDGDEVEDGWGEFMNDWSKGTGYEDIRKTAAEYVVGGVDPMDTAYDGAEMGIKLTMLCIGYEAREEWYADNCDGD